MKQDSYPRFIKSETYKVYLMREMEGKSLDLPKGEHEGTTKGNKKEDKKKKSKETEEKDKEKRRRSLLPWRQSKSSECATQIIGYLLMVIDCRIWDHNLPFISAIVPIVKHQQALVWT